MNRESRKGDMPRQYTAAEKAAVVGDVTGHGPAVPAGTDTGGVSPPPPGRVLLVRPSYRPAICSCLFFSSK